MTAVSPENVCSEKTVFSPEEAGRELGVQCLSIDAALPIAGASLDTRTLKPGSLFVALKGELQDGHDYLEEAFRRGASAALISQEYGERHRHDIAAQACHFKNLLPVPSVEEALAKLASWRRRLFQGKVLAVTGSVGKTSTKEMLGYLLAKRFSGLTSSGNFNNHLGLPLNLIALDQAQAFCLAELGASKPGDIRFLADILKPTHGMITQISPSHLEGFGSLEAIYRTKLELAESLPEGGLCMVPDFDPVLLDKTKSLHRRWLLVGQTQCADYRLSQVRMDGRFVEFNLAGRRTYRVPAAASFFAQNAAMAAAMADQLGFSLEEQPEEWDDFSLPAGRFERKEVGDGVTVIYDGYNASPASFRCSVKGFQDLQVTGRKAVIFADMLELGSEEVLFHHELGELLAGAGFEFIGAYGDLAGRALEMIRTDSACCEVKLFKNPEEAGSYLASYLKKGDAVLLKASRGMRMDKALKAIEAGLPSHSAS